MTTVPISEFPGPVRLALRDGTSPIAYPIDSEPCPSCQGVGSFDWKPFDAAPDGSRTDCATCDASGRVPPARWEALTRPCDECLPSKLRMTAESIAEALGASMFDPFPPCPAGCVAGRPVIDITDTCPTCNGEGAASRLWGHVCYTCSTPYGISPGAPYMSSGSVRVARVTAQLYSVGPPNPCPETPHAYVRRDGSAWTCDGNGDHPQQIHPLTAPEPGQWLLVLERVPETRP